MEPTTTIFAVCGGKLAYDVLGPSAKYLGEEVRGLAQVGAQNIKRVFEHAQKRNLELGKTSGTVAPRLLHPILQSAYFCEDELVASYLGGVLSSARTEVNRDDRPVGIVRMIDGLSSYALRIHCLVYSSVVAFPRESPKDMFKWLRNGHGVTVLFDESKLREKMDFVDGENPEEIMEHAFLSLDAHDLLSEGHRHFRLHKPGINARFCRLSLRGVELFCWGNGQSQGGSHEYFLGNVKNNEIAQLAIEPLEIQLGHVSWA
jgi:hypothetical protein